MVVLPLLTQLALEAIPRRHAPEQGKFDTYRDCLRWEFGFSCAFCLLHEADLFAGGIAGTGLTWIEHRNTQKDAPEQANWYRNCFYSCRFCNQARASRPLVDRAGRTLIDPMSAAWGKHFALEGAEMSVRHPADRDASYTYEAYDLGDPRKRKLRDARRESLENARRIVRDGPSRCDELLRAAGRAPADIARLMVEQAEILNNYVGAATQALLRFRAIPEDAPADCRCRPPGTRRLPAFLESQCWER